MGAIVFDSWRVIGLEVLSLCSLDQQAKSFNLAQTLRESGGNGLSKLSSRVLSIEATMVASQNKIDMILSAITKMNNNK